MMPTVVLSKKKGGGGEVEAYLCRLGVASRQSESVRRTLFFLSILPSSPIPSIQLPVKEGKRKDKRREEGRKEGREAQPTSPLVDEPHNIY